MKWKSKLGTVIDIPDGLDPAVVKKWKAKADEGYGTLAQKQLNAAAKKGGKTPTDGSGNVQVGLNNLGNAGVGNDGTIDIGKAGNVLSEAEKEDIRNNFRLNNPDQTDEFGNTVHYELGDDGRVTVTRSGGRSSQFADLAAQAASKYAQGDGERKRAEEATYNTLTRNYDRDMSRELEAVKQEMANRGIPYDPAAAQDPNTNNLYGKTVGGVSEKYRTLKDQAAQQAVLSGNQAFATNAAAAQGFVNTAAGAASQFAPRFDQYQGQTVDSSGMSKDLMTLSSAAFLQKYGVDKSAATARLGYGGRGGGGGRSGGSGNSGGGFEILA